MSNTTEAWQALYAAQTEATGVAITATVNLIPNIQAICSELTLDEVLAAGGTAEDGGYKLQILASNFPAGTDLKLKPVTVFDTPLQVLNSNFNNGVLYLICGDFVAKE